MSSTLPVILVPHPHIRVDPNVLGGSPYVRGSRVPVRRIYSLYQSGASFEKLAKRYPQLGSAKVLDALSFALDNEETIKADCEREESFLAGHPMSSVGKSIDLVRRALRADDTGARDAFDHAIKKIAEESRHAALRDAVDLIGGRFPEAAIPLMELVVSESTKIEEALKEKVLAAEAELARLLAQVSN